MVKHKTNTKNNTNELKTKYKSNSSTHNIPKKSLNPSNIHENNSNLPQILTQNNGEGNITYNYYIGRDAHFYEPRPKSNYNLNKIITDLSLLIKTYPVRSIICLSLLGIILVSYICIVWL